MSENVPEYLQQPPNSDEEVISRCQIARALEEKGQFEAAAEALGDLWRGIGQRPETARMEATTEAEVLLQCGTLTGWLGSTRHVAGAQEQAKDLLFEALATFRSQGMASKASEAQYELGICYWRLGAFDEARLMMTEAMKSLTDEDVELKAKILIRRTLVDISENKYYEALDLLKEAEPLFGLAGDALKGRWHGQKGLIFRRLATAEHRAEYFDSAIMEYTAAIFHYEQAKHERYCGTNLNNLAFLLYKLGRYRDAHEQLDRAQLICTKLKDPGTLAQVDETRARVLAAEKRYLDADRVIGSAIKAFEQGGESALLADALATQGATLARLGRRAAARASFARASEIAECAGNLAGAGLAKLSMLEELHDHLSYREARALYISADSFLQDMQHPETIARLRVAARLLLDVPNEQGADVGPSLVVSFDDFPREVRTYCEQYLLYFIQFLQDLGIEAIPELRHEAGQVLFTVTPTNQQEALEKIWAALKVYLYLPSNPVSSSVSNEIAVKRLEYAVTGLQRELRLAEAELQAKNATIEAQQLIINVQKGLSSGEIVINSQTGVTQKTTGEDREEIFNGVAAFTLLKKSGVEINLAKIFRWLKEKFTKPD